VARFRLTRAARADLLSIGESTLSNFGPLQYDEYMGGLEAYCQRLAEEPILARPYRPLPATWGGLAKPEATE
jgi:plasmid stabilization system protein ParE